MSLVAILSLLSEQGYEFGSARSRLIGGCIADVEGDEGTSPRP